MKKSHLLIVPFVVISALALFGYFGNDSFNLASIINFGSRSHKNIALTFDADMTPTMLANLKSGKVKSYYDQEIISILNKESTPTTIFITGLWANAYPDAVKQFSENPLLEIGNHSYDHGAFKMPCYKLPPVQDKKEEVKKTQEILFKITGKYPEYFRFPGGCFDQKDVDLVESLGLKVVGWDVISGDSFSTDEYGITKKVMDGVTSGSIIVMHLSGGLNAPKTSTILPNIIHMLKNKGFNFVTVSKLLSSP